MMPFVGKLSVLIKATEASIPSSFPSGEDSRPLPSYSGVHLLRPDIANSRDLHRSSFQEEGDESSILSRASQQLRAYGSLGVSVPTCFTA